MAVRKRFKETERKAFVPGTPVEWLNGSSWRPGVIVSRIEVDANGRYSVGVQNEGSTRTIRNGQIVASSPGSVRLRKEVVPTSTTVPSVATVTLPQQTGLF